MTLQAQIKQLSAMLGEVCESSDEAVYEAREIMRSLLSCSFTNLFCRMDTVIPEKLSINARSIAAQRLSHTPLYYCLGKAPFYSREFYVNSSVLIPRPETEELTQKAIEYINSQGSIKVLDLCTGSGCIAVTIKLECPNASVYASDISLEALETARQNAKLLKAKIAFEKSDVLNEIPETGFDLIICNPPYIDAKSCEKLPSDVQKEPMLALYGGEDGMSIYRRISKGLSGTLKSGGALMLEIGYDQGKTVPMLFEGMFSSINVFKDISGNDRIVTLYGYKPNKGEIVSGC